MSISEKDVQQIALSLPETTARPSYGTPAWWVRDKWFARIHEQGDVLVLWCADEGEKQALIAGEPGKFFTTSHYDGYRLVLVRFAAIDVDELTELVTESWRLRAPKKLREELDSRGS
jgi:hypothetical protein